MTYPRSESRYRRFAQTRVRDGAHGGSPPPGGGRPRELALLGALALSALLALRLAVGVRRRLRRASRPAPARISPPARIRAAATGSALTLAVVGDFGRCRNGGRECEREEAVARLVDSWNPDYVLTTGDNNYPKGEASTLAANLQPYRRYIEEGRFLPTLGNHDWACRGCPRPYLAQFRPPGNGRYYSVQLGGLGLWVLDSDEREPDGIDVGSAQARWLREGLAGSGGLNLVFLHHPPYSSGRHGSSERLRWPFAEWGADGVFSGHEHDYERVEAAGIPYFVNGSGGAQLRRFRRPVRGSKVRYCAGHGAQKIVWDGEAATVEFWSVSRRKVDSVSLHPRTRRVTT